MTSTDWEAMGVGVSAAVAVLAANAYLMKLVIRNCINEALLVISEKYVTKEHLNSHQRTCPHQYQKQKANEGADE
jgi:hypothetical protein